jgi:alginate O-acetyltransferase complex protein AlgI
LVFSSPLFLFFFLPAVLVIYYGVRQLTQTVSVSNSILLISSCIFYLWGAPKTEYLLLFIAGIAIDFRVAILIAKYRVIQPTFARSLLIFSVAANLAFLAYYKYANLLSDIFGSEQKLFYYWDRVLLPIGISFFVFHKISYLVDVYRTRVAPKSNFRDLTLYLLFFPQLIAGPIIRYHTIADQIDQRSHSLDMMFEGICPFLHRSR